MKDLTGSNKDNNEDELQRIPEFMLASGYFDRRQQQILESQLTINSLQRGINSVMFDIAHLLVATPSEGNQAMLQRSFGELQGLANAVSQTAAAPSGSDSGASRGAEVDLNGTRYAIESRANFSGGNASKDLNDKTGNKAAKIKDLSAPDPVTDSGKDQVAPDEAKPAGDTRASNLDRVNKLASAESRGPDDRTAPAASDLPPLPNKRSSRSNIAALKLDHTQGEAKSDAPDRQPVQAAEPTAQTAPPLTKAEPANATAIRKPPSPGGM